MPLPQGKTILPQAKAAQKAESPAGLWMKCKECGQLLEPSALQSAHQACPLCGYHYPMTAFQRIALLADEGTFREMNRGVASMEPLPFGMDGSYPAKLQETMDKTSLPEAVVTGDCRMEGYPVALGVMDFRFFGASMGSAAGEKVTRLAEFAIRGRRALVLATCGGGVRMQEGALSLMQMARISGALMRLGEAGLPYIAVLTNPAAGWGTAGFASLGDVIFAEPGALIGGAGPRDIKRAAKAELPEGFQTAESLLGHGAIDRIVQRKDLKSTIVQVISAWKCFQP